MKRLFFDIETAPNVCYVWRTGYKLNVPASNIVEEKRIICVAYRFEGEQRTHALTWDDKLNDKALCKAFIEVANNATEIVAHNGDRFDVPWLRARCLYHGLVFPDVPSLDTCKQSRRLFNLNSHALDYIAKHLGVGCKIPTGFSLWARCMRGNKAALAEMVKYCKHDVTVLQEVFERLKPHLKPSVHHGVAAGRSRASCPMCGSVRTKISKRRITAAGLGRVQLVCNECGKYTTIPTTTYERALA